MDRITVRLAVNETVEQARGSHSAYIEPDGTLVIDWYHHGPEASHEFAHMLKLDAAQQAVLAKAMGVEPGSAKGFAFLGAIQGRFPSYFEIKAFLETEGVPFSEEIDRNP